jgi:elongator complex protein 1
VLFEKANMRNLEIVKSLILPPCSFLESPEAFSVDVDTGDIWIVDKNGLFSISSSASKRSVEPVVSIVDSGLLPEGADIIGLQHVPDMEIVCMAVSTGEVLTFSTATNELDCAGTLDNGITSMAWSPDQEVVLFTSGTGKIVLMNKEFDPIIEVNMHSTEFGESKPVTVGWGKKETQFHGSLGKQSAAKKKEDALPCFSWDDQKVGVCWRGDGQFFVVSSVSPATGNRILRVWTRECTLHSTSEEVVGMEQALYWRPTGNLMATSQRKPNKHDIIFFEPNGLRHGEFSLPCDRMEMKVKDLMWNADSSVLAVILENLSQKELETYNEQHGRILPCTVPEQIVQKSRVQLWYMSNYHWYLKQELRFDEGAGSSDGCTRLAQILWDPILPYKLHILTAEGRYMCYEWRWTVSRNRVLSPENTACVAVADGDQLLLTPFRRCVVPPPMSAHQLSLSSPVSCVTFGPLESPNDMLVVTSDGDIGWYSHQPNRESPDNTERDGEGFRNIASGPRLLAAGKLPRAAHLGCKETSGSLSVLSARHFCWWEKSTLLCVAWDADLHQDSILFYTLQVEEQEGSKLGRISLTQRKCFACDRSVLSMATNPHTKTVVAQFDDGTIWRVDPEAGLREWFEGTGLSLSFPQLCSLIELGSFGGEEVVVGLTDRHRLFFNDREIAADCMSFCFHDDFFLFTTHSHTCRVIGLHTPLKDIPRMTGEKTAMFDESLRRVERGSKIVTAVPSDTKVILQMPRGNLETIHPRALVLSCVRKGLDKLEFKKVFQLMKKHRINMNITVDHNPQVFFANIGLFVSQLDDTTAINLFLTELREENITETMYKGLGASGGSVQTGSKETGSNQLGSKVDRVCDAMIAELTQQGRSRFLLSIVTAHVKKSKPEMEAALLRIKHVKDHPPSPPSGGSTADEALKYLLYLVDVNELYNVALGMYDFDLVLFVAERSQKDPKEYLPYLNHLRKMDSCYMRYNIDKKLGRFKKALEHIVACGEEGFLLSAISDLIVYSICSF